MITVEQALQQRQMKRSESYIRASARSEELRSRIPELAAIDNELAHFPTKLLQLPKGEGREAAFAELKQQTNELSARRKQMIKAAGYDPEYDAVRYDCPKCSDSGFVDGELCDCIKQVIAADRYKNGGIGRLLLGMTFDSFDLRYYKGDDRDAMQQVLSICKKYAETFGTGSKSLLLMGGTGLGKTHLSSAIAQTAISRGYDAFYETAPQMFSNYEAVKYGRADQSVLEPYGSALLLIDDLGAEATSNLNSATLFEVINRRLLSGKPTVISTNLSPAEIKKRYDERIYSRLMGEFAVLQFKGKDIRMQKIMEDA